MINAANIFGDVGAVTVHATVNRGHSAEELTDMALNKIIHVGKDLSGPIRDQALAYRVGIRDVLLFYIRQAMLSERVTMRAELLAEMKEQD